MGLGPERFGTANRFVSKLPELCGALVQKERVEKRGIERVEDRAVVKMTGTAILAQQQSANNTRSYTEALTPRQSTKNKSNLF